MEYKHVDTTGRYFGNGPIIFSINHNLRGKKYTTVMLCGEAKLELFGALSVTD